MLARRGGGTSTSAPARTPPAPPRAPPRLAPHRGPPEALSMVLIPARGSAGWGQQPPPVRAPTIPHAQNHPLMSSWAIMYAPKSQPHPSLGHPETHNYSQNQTPTHLHTHDSKSHSHPGVTPFPIFLHFSSTPTPEHTHNLTPNGHTHTPKNCFHSHTSISKIHRKKQMFIYDSNPRHSFPRKFTPNRCGLCLFPPSYTCW